jgi:diguanylate cyclase (GGDEF)-like protein
MTMRRWCTVLSVALVGVLHPAAPANADLAVTAPAIERAMPVPGPITGPELATIASLVRTDVAMFRDALDAGRFGVALEGDRERFDDLDRRLAALEARGDSITELDLFPLMDEFMFLLVELASRPGADPATVAMVNVVTQSNLTPVPLPATTVPATVPTTIPPTPPVTAAATLPATVPATVPVTAAGAAPATAPAVRIEAATGPAPNGAGWSLQTWLLLVIAGAAVLSIVLYAAERRHRRRLPKPTGRPGFHDLLDVGRRLAGAGSTEEVEEMAVRQAMRLTRADAGAFIRHHDRRLSVGFESEAAMLVADRLRDGALDRVVGTGHELIQVSSSEPAIRNLPVSMLAAPVYLAGSVVGAVVLLRDAADPFDDHDLRMITDIKPIVGAALEQVHHTQHVRAEALTDGLTGVRNRRALDLAVAALGDGAFAAVMVDLDHFKAINDEYGHHGGDEVLRAAAARLVANVRPGDQVYRYGGEEFSILMPDTVEATAAEVAERVRGALASTPFLIGPTRIEHWATASFGVAAGAGGTQVLADADAALYEAKRTGRNRVMLDSAVSAAR